MAFQVPHFDAPLKTNALEMRPDYLRALVRAIPLGVCGVDTNGQVLFLNPAGEKLIGQREEDCCGQSFHQLTQCHIEADAFSQVGCPVSHVLQTGRTVRSTRTFFQVSEERRQPVEYECIPLLEESITGALISFRDLSRQLELERDRQRLISIPEESPGPIVEFDSHANMVYANPVMRDLLVKLGFSNSALPTILPANLMSLIQECLHTHLTVEGVEVDNGRWCYAWSFSPLPEMHLVRAYGVDLTERKKAEQELRRAKEVAEEATRAKSEFLSTMSHELRTPLAVILGYCDLLEDDESGNLEAEQQTGLQRIRKSATDLLDLITALLDLNRLEAGQLPVHCQEVEITALISELQAETQGLQDQSSLTFVWTVDANLSHMWTDLRKLKVIVKNLIGNAVKFTQNGSVAVVVRSQQDGIEISVVDTGMGIPSDELTRIFEPFQQVDNSANGLLKGSGLGLNIVKRFVTLLGGTVTVESEVGHGTTFRIWLPCNRETSQDS